jgi:glycosyl transferase family 25
MSLNIKSIEDINHAFYINLEHRIDRKIHVEKQLATIGVKAERFNAVKMPNGAIGCSISHLKILENAKKNNLPHVMICEDDITFLNPELFKSQLNTFLSNHDNWDVILLAGNNMPPFEVIDATAVKVTRCQTATGYIVNGNYIDTLIQNSRAGLTMLLKEPQTHVKYAYDKYWFLLQEKDNWYLITPLTVIQMSNYSDIEKRDVNYQDLMLDINKERYTRYLKFNEFNKNISKI